MKAMFKNLIYIKPHDLYDPFIFIFAFILSIPFKVFLKASHKRLWLIMEDGKHARDNGYYFFKYMLREHPQDFFFFVIDKKSKDILKLDSKKRVVNFRSIKHWIYYLSATFNISNQKYGNPSAALFYIIHVVFGWYNNRVFLQHGITINRSPWIFYPKTKFRFFICGAKKEFDYITKEFGYPKDRILLTGFPRFDFLQNVQTDSRQILIMPTWRNWLGRDTNILGGKIDFVQTEYFKHWSELLTDHEFIKFIEEEDIEVLFYPHANMQKYISYFPIRSKNIKLLDFSVDIQTTLKTADLMVTDYSSVLMDFAYLGKPIVFFQFDLEKYRSMHLSKGYFEYSLFGDICTSTRDVVANIKYYDNSQYAVKPPYLRNMQEFFDIKDDKNSERIYEILKGNE